MARSFSSAKAVFNEISALVTRRGFCASTTQGGGVSRSGTPSSSVMLKKGSEESGKVSWVPDPVTGYYRPETQVKEINAAELRNMLINNKTRQH